MGSCCAPRPATGLCLLLTVVSGCNPPPPPEHGEAETTESVTLAAGELELFMEHPHLIAGEGAKFNVHLTVLTDGMPITGGRLTVVGTGPTGKAVTVVQEAPKRPGIFGPVIAFPEAGPNEMRLTLEGRQATEAIRVPVTVYPDQSAAETAARAAAGVEPEGAITFLKEQAWKVGLVHEAVTTRRLVERLVVPGEIHPAAGSRALVTPPTSGRVLPPPGGTFPQVGRVVRAGDLMALIEPPLAGPTGASMLANRAQIQTLLADVAVKLKEAEIDIKKAKVELDHTRIELERYRSLFSSKAVPQRELDEAERNHSIAEATHQGRLEARDLYEQARRDLLAMLGTDRLDSGPSSPDLRSPTLPLKAPLSGTITEAKATEGEYIDSTHPLFTVINLDRVWLEARVSEYDLERVVKAPAATFTLAAYPGRRFDVLGEGVGRLVDVGSVVDPGSRTLPVRYELINAGRLFRVGLFADVAIETDRAEKAIAVPESAIVDEDGRPTAYVLLDGEHFQKRDLVLGLRDSGLVEVKDGLKLGERVVTRGAYAIRLASVSAVIPAHGHTH